VEVTAACNRFCQYCYTRYRETAADLGPELSGPELVALVERVLKESGRRSVQLSGGEPLLRPDLFDIVRALRARDRTVSLVTDGGLVDDAAAATLKELGVGPVQPTLLAADREVHDHLKGAASFDATVAAIERLRKAAVLVAVSYVCTSLNHDRFREVVELCFALGVEVVAFSRLCTTGMAALNRAQLEPDADMVASCLDVAREANEKLGMKVKAAISLPLCVPRADQLAGLKLGRCALGTEAPGYTVDPWGRLRACSVSPVILGDLRVEWWNDIMARASATYFREVSAVPPACQGCSLEARCGGGCRESARAAFGTLAYPDPLARVRG
jgi:radical SAM protein with 4Fe4S-binding SPASM domain